MGESFQAPGSVPAAPGESGDVLVPPPVAEIDELALTCGSPARFHPDALRGRVGAESADHPAAAALRRLLDHDRALRGRQGWYLVALSDTGALFIVPGRPGEDIPYWMAEFEKRGDRWTFARSGQCEIRPSFEGIGQATWTLAPGQPLTPHTEVINVLVAELACASGSSPEGRLVPAAAVYQETAIIIIYGVRPLHGPQTCQAAPAAATRLRLSEPLGDRQLLDGGVLPPAVRGGPPRDDDDS